MIRILLFLIKSYQYLISPLLPATCRFTPSCSNYFREALLKHGIICGTLYGVWRIMRCNPFGASGYDPVP